jgi:hypothetical protein
MIFIIPFYFNELEFKIKRKYEQWVGQKGNGVGDIWVLAASREKENLYLNIETKKNRINTYENLHFINSVSFILDNLKKNKLWQ